MKKYDINNYIKDNRKQYIIFSTSYISPLKCIKEIENELKNKVNYETEVIFDLLLSSGNTKERYGRVVFNKNGFDRNSFEYIEVPKKSEIRAISINYYKNRDEYIENSILTSIQKKMINKGIII